VRCARLKLIFTSEKGIVGVQGIFNTILVAEHSQDRFSFLIFEEPRPATIRRMALFALALLVSAAAAFSWSL
jgi:hypothetical protein